MIELKKNPVGTLGNVIAVGSGYIDLLVFCTVVPSCGGNRHLAHYFKKELIYPSMDHVLYLCTPLVFQHSLSVLPRCRGAALPLRMAAHVHPRSASSNAGHCLHPDTVHCWSAVQFSVPAH